MVEDGRVHVRKVIDPQIEEHLVNLLEGWIDLPQFSFVFEEAGCRDKDPKGHVESQVRMLHILNLTFKAVQSERVIHKALEHLGKEGHLLHLPSQDPTMSYRDAVLDRGRLLLPLEYANMLTSFQGLEIVFKQAVDAEDHGTIRALVERAKSMIPNKATVLARMEGYTYEKVLDEFMSTSGAVELIDVDQFIEFVAMQSPALEVTSECRLQLSRDLVTMDILLSNAEMQRTPENRMTMMKDIMATAPKYHFVLENNMRSKAFYEAYTHMFDLEDVSRPMIKWKCDGECMGCPNWKKSLARPGPLYGHM